MDTVGQPLVTVRAADVTYSREGAVVHRRDSMENAITWLLVTLVGSFGGSWFGAYFKKKGENYATHEDINKLVDQVKAVTAATKEIEARISTEVWNRQRRWELKRDVLLDAMKRLGALPTELSNLHAVYQTAPVGLDQALIDEKRLRESEKWSEASSGFDAAVFLTALVCGEEVVNALRVFSLFARQCSANLMEGNSVPVHKWTAELVDKFQRATEAARKELEVDRHGVGRLVPSG